MTYVQGLEEHVGGDIEALCVRTVGIKNYDVPGQLSDQLLPVEVGKVGYVLMHYDDEYYKNVILLQCLNENIFIIYLAAVHCAAGRAAACRVGGAAAATLPSLADAASHRVHRRQKGLPPGRQAASFLALRSYGEVIW